MRVLLVSVLLGATGLPGPVSGQQTPSPSELRPLTIEVGDLVFDALESGPADGPVVLFLHGFPQTSYAFRAQLRELGAQGFRAIAPDQRGYSPGARPAGVEPYGMGHLVGDVMGMASAVGAERFDLVGHDWGGAVAWVVATRFPDRVKSLTVLSTPHYAALSAARSDADTDQGARSAYFADFAADGAERNFLSDDAAFLRAIYSGLPADAVEHYMDALGNPEALRAALAWYAATFGAAASSGSGGPPSTVAPVRVPTLYVWSTEDTAFGRSAAEATERYVDAPYRFEILEGVDHWVAERAPERITSLILEHIRTR